MSIFLKLGEAHRLAGARQREAGGDGALAERQPRAPETTRRGAHHFRYAFLDAQPDVGWTGDAFSERGPGKFAQPRPAARPAAIDSEKQHLVFHLESQSLALI